MKRYPTQIWLSVSNPATGKSEMRWFPVNNEQHEKFVRSQIASAKDTIATARKRMAEAIGADPQKMIVENLQKEFIEFHSREATHGKLDGIGGETRTESRDEGLVHPDSGPPRPDSASGSGSGQTQGRESGQEGVDGAGVREGSQESIPIEVT